MEDTSVEVMETSSDGGNNETANYPKKDEKVGMTAADATVLLDSFMNRRGPAMVPVGRDTAPCVWSTPQQQQRVAQEPLPVSLHPRAHHTWVDGSDTNCSEWDM